MAAGGGFRRGGGSDFFGHGASHRLLAWTRRLCGYSHLLKAPSNDLLPVVLDERKAAEVRSFEEAQLGGGLDG